MSEVQSVGAPDVRLSIARAAQATGVDFDYLLAQAKLESSLNPNATAKTSSAAGLYQFIGSTWLETIDRHGSRYGLGWAEAAIAGGKGGAKISDPTARSQIMALRYDPETSSLMAAELAKDNQSDLRASLGRDPDYAELYLAHFMGSDGAQRFLTALQQQPGSSAAALFPKQAAANRPVFFDGAGNPRSVTQVMDLLRQRLNQAMEEEGGIMPLPYSGAYAPTGSMQAPPPLGPLAREFRDAAASHAAPSRKSMVETLNDTFAGGSNRADALPENVRAAYSRLKAYGL